MNFKGIIFLFFFLIIGIVILNNCIRYTNYYTVSQIDERVYKQTIDNWRNNETAGLIYAYQNIGEQDITAHVNFSSVKKWGEELGFKTLGFCQQGTFLIALGIDEIMRELYETSPDYLFEVAKIKRLIFPGTMGETHKVIVQYKGNGYPKLRGFSIKNQADKL